MMKNNKCPCKECILLAVCMSRLSVNESIGRCHMLLDYLKNKNRIEEIIKLFKPGWYRRRPGQLPDEVNHLSKVVRRRMRAKRERNGK